MNIFVALPEEQLVPFVAAAETWQLDQEEPTAKWNQSQKSVAQMSTFARSLALTTVGVGVLGICYLGSKEILPFHRRNAEETSNPYPSNFSDWCDDKNPVLNYPEDALQILHRLTFSELFPDYWTIERVESQTNLWTSTYDFRNNVPTILRNLEDKGSVDNKLRANIVSDLLEKCLNGKSEIGGYIAASKREEILSNDELKSMEDEMSLCFAVPNIRSCKIMKWGSSKYKIEHGLNMIRKTLTCSDKEFVLCFEKVQNCVSDTRRILIRKKVFLSDPSSSAAPTAQSSPTTAENCDESKSSSKLSLNPEAQVFVPQIKSEASQIKLSWPKDAISIYLLAAQNGKFPEITLEANEMPEASEEEQKKLRDGTGKIWDVISMTESPKVPRIDLFDSLNKLTCNEIRSAYTNASMTSRFPEGVGPVYYPVSNLVS